MTCSTWTPPVTLRGTDPDPRFIRMEFVRGLPIMVYSAANDTELRLSRCEDQACRRLETRVIASAQKVRHPGLAAAVDGSILVAAELSNNSAAPLGCRLLLLRVTPSDLTVASVALVDQSKTPYVHTGVLPDGGFEMPCLIDGGRHLAYWRTESRELVLVFEVGSGNSSRVVVDSNRTAPGTRVNPGAWVRGVALHGGTLLLAYWDLGVGLLLLARCDPGARRCSVPEVADSNGRLSLTDYGAGAFPDFRGPHDGDGGPVLAYFSEDDVDGAGLLKLLVCADARCARPETTIAAQGAPGFGRDASIAFTPGAMLATFLDLQGRDSPADMAARLAVFTSARADACTDDLGCQLNGHCTEGRCVCDAAWRGPACGQLALGQSAVAVRYEALPAAGGAWTWGGSPIVDDAGKWHLFFSAMVLGCGLLHYQTNSVVRHAVADTVAGPWTVLGTALAPRSAAWDSGGVHAPSIQRDPISRRYLLFYEATNRSEPPLDCRYNSSVPAVYISRTRRIGVASAASPYGPWERLDDPILAPRAGAFWDAGDVSNAAPLVLPNGSTILGYRAGGDGVALGGGIGIAAAPRWRGPYSRVGPSATGALFAAEDGAVYRDRRGHFHMLVHRFAGVNGSTAGDAVGGHAWSVDGIEWRYDQDAVAYTSVVAWQNGTRANMYRRERPKPVLAAGGIVALFNGAWPCHAGSEEVDAQDGASGCYSFTIQTEVLGAGGSEALTW